MITTIFLGMSTGAWVAIAVGILIPILIVSIHVMGKNKKSP